MPLNMMKIQNLIYCCLLAAGISRADPAPTLPTFDEACQILGANLQGFNAQELDHAALLGLVHQLEPRVSLAGAGEDSSNAAPLAGTRVFESSFAYVRAAGVTAGLPEAFRAAFQEMTDTNKGKIKGLVLDLRFSGGFDYAAAAKLADCFLNAGHPLLDWKTGSARSTPKTNAITIPVAVLVNAKTTGSAEALAAVLRDTDVALVIGSQTAGQASIYKEFPLRDGTTLRVAVAPVSFGADKTLSHGLTPDIAIATSLEDERAYLRDPFKPLHAPQPAKNNAASETLDQPRLNEAELIRMHRNGESPDESSPVGAAEAPTRMVVDPALARALDLLKGLAVVQPNRPG